MYHNILIKYVKLDFIRSNPSQCTILIFASIIYLMLNFLQISNEEKKDQV